MRRWFRQFVRKRTNPIPRGYAADIKHKLSSAYVFAAYNAFGILLFIFIAQYYPMTDREKKEPGRYYARLWQGEDVTVYKVAGLKIMDSYQIKGTPELRPSQSEVEPSVENTSENIQK